MIMLATSAVCCREHTYRQLTIKGSDTEVNLVVALAEAYMERDSQVSISVTGGGSGAGIAALINGKTDIANASRAMDPAELALASARGVRPVPLILALDAIAVVVQADLAVDSLTLAQLSGLYRGTVRNWRSVGGPDLPVSLYGRQSNSGTFAYFRDSVIRGEYAPSLKQLNGSAQLVEALRKDRAGVGYVGAGYVRQADGTVRQGVKVLKIIVLEGRPAEAPLSPEAVYGGAYPLVRPLYQYVDGPPKGALLAFLRFCQGEEGRRLITESGYFPVPAAAEDWSPPPTTWVDDAK
jgi:phosphate transport system substrate-binding protein